MSFPSESDMVSKELQNSDLTHVNLMTDVFKIIVKYRRKIIVKYCHLSPSGNRALGSGLLIFLLEKLNMVNFIIQVTCFYWYVKIDGSDLVEKSSFKMIFSFIFNLNSDFFYCLNCYNKSQYNLNLIRFQKFLSPEVVLFL